MVQQQVEVDVARGKRELSNREVLGFFAGNKKAKNSVTSWLFAPNARSYKRRQTVWLCEDCSKKRRLIPRGFGKGVAKFIGMTWICMPALYLADPSNETNLETDVLVFLSVAAVIYGILIVKKCTKRWKDRLFPRHYIFVVCYFVAALSALLNPQGAFHAFSSIVVVASICIASLLNFRSKRSPIKEIQGKGL
ncbi:MAG: hypothetical protein JXQ89_15850 [Pelagimonas sp.]